MQRQHTYGQAWLGSDDTYLFVYIYFVTYQFECLIIVYYRSLDIFACTSNAGLLTFFSNALNINIILNL